MSEAAVIAFHNAIKKNSRIKKEIIAIRKNYPKKKLSSQDTYEILTQEIIPLAKKYNYIFSFDDYIDCQLKEEYGSLSDEDLFNISGGSIFKELGFASAASMLSLTDNQMKDI
ncbi:MAG: hypothetical protein LBF33_01630 [Oscillospiraceae bacterium]|jgi:hypothetical protein|nr:hypothetical protein [Oscillospiraceae bacterium]